MENQRLLSNIHPLQYPDRGQNYVFNGCMNYLMECLGEKEEYNYYFFSFMSGDCVTQVFGQDRNCWHPCFSQAHFDYDLIKQVFDRIGYSFTYVTPDQLKVNTVKYRKMILSYIDRGLPVIGKGFHNFWNGKIQLTDEVSCIVGYEKDGQTLFRLPEESTDLMPVSLEDDYPYTLVFVGEKVLEPELSAAYKKAFYRIPDLLTVPLQNNVSFGIQAFRDWADAIQGDYYHISKNEFDDWKLYKIYVCNLATNLFSKQIVQSTFLGAPELEHVRADFNKIYADMEKSYTMLKDFGGEFNITYETLQDNEKCRAIAETILQFANHYKNLCDLIKEMK